MNKPLREHYETPTDVGDALQTFRYIDDLEKYIKYLEQFKPNGQLPGVMQAEGSDVLDAAWKALEFVGFQRGVEFDDDDIRTMLASKKGSEGATVGNSAAGIGVCVDGGEHDYEIEHLHGGWCSKCEKMIDLRA